MARLFNGTNEGMYNDTVAASAYPVTMACWVRPANVTAEMCAMAFTNSGANQNHTLELLTNGAITGDKVMAFTRSDASSSWTNGAQSSTAFVADTWQHVCGVWAANNDARVYLNGGNKGTSSFSHTDHSASWNRNSVGMVADSGSWLSWFAGRLGECGIWNVALSDNEVKMLAAGISPLRVQPGNLLRYWNVFGLVSPEPDYSSSGQDLTLNNSPSLAGHAPVGPMFAFESPSGLAGVAAEGIGADEMMAARQLGSIQPVQIPTAVVPY